MSKWNHICLFHLEQNADILSVGDIKVCWFGRILGNCVPSSMPQYLCWGALVLNQVMKYWPHQPVGLFLWLSLLPLIDSAWPWQLTPACHENIIIFHVCPNVKKMESTAYNTISFNKVFIIIIKVSLGISWIILIFEEQKWRIPGHFKKS